MTYANSTINPIIYAFSNEIFKQNYSKLFPYLFKRNSQSSSRSHVIRFRRSLPEKEMLFDK
jgi:hypothetical protein